MAEIGHEEVAFRLVRALRLDTAMRDDDRLALKARVLWPSYSYDRADLNCQHENAVWLRQIEAQAARLREWDNRPARDDYLEVMRWVAEVERLSRPALTEAEQGRVLELRACGLGWRAIARRLGLSSRSVGMFLGVKRGLEPERHKPAAAFVRLVALDLDWRSIGRHDHTDAEGAKRRWAGIVALVVEIANGRGVWGDVQREGGHVAREMESAG